MPQAEMQWWHCIISTHNSWLPGDRRGFRTRRHKIHSSGDYKSPPPEAEHAGLRHYHEQHSGDAAVVPADCKATVGWAIIGKLRKKSLRVLAIAVAGTHSHMLAELPIDAKAARFIVGECKTVSSHAVRNEIPGQVWARGGKFIRIDNVEHQRNTYHYILNQADAWIWKFRSDCDDVTAETPEDAEEEEPRSSQSLTLGLDPH